MIQVRNLGQVFSAAPILSAAGCAAPSWSPSTAVANWDDSGGNHNGDLPTFLATADIPSVSTLTLVGVGLTSLTCLQSLPVLETLDCSNNLLTALDVRGMGSLLTVTCTGNAISSLLVAGASSLLVVECSGNPLPNLDALLIPVAATLQELTCVSCTITNFNLPPFAVLQRLVIASNAITTLDFSASSSLTVLDIGNTNIALIDTAGVDLSYAPLVTLRGVNCDLLTQITSAGLPNGSLVSANFSNCDLLAVADFSSKSNLTTLNLAGDVLLVDLNCSNCQLGTLNITGDFAITTLDFSNNPAVVIIGP